MSLSCSCDGDYEWFYVISEDDHSAESAGPCYGCCGAVSAGETVHKILRFEQDEDGNDMESEVLGMMCEDCLDMIENLKALGYCLYANLGFVQQAHKEYLEQLPENHIMRLQK